MRVVKHNGIYLAYYFMNAKAWKKCRPTFFHTLLYITRTVSPVLDLDKNCMVRCVSSPRGRRWRDWIGTGTILGQWRWGNRPGSRYGKREPNLGSTFYQCRAAREKVFDLTIGLKTTGTFTRVGAMHKGRWQRGVGNVSWSRNGQISEEYTNLEVNQGITSCSIRHGGGRSKKINAWYLNTLMVYL